jgi:CDP-paratose 2-epimerase
MGRPYKVYGYKGKQVRDQIHSRDVAALFFEFFRNPRPGEVYNLGGGRSNSLSILETIDILREMSFGLKYEITTQKPNRRPHVLYIRSDKGAVAFSPMASDVQCREQPD